MPAGAKSNCKKNFVIQKVKERAQNTQVHPRSIDQNVTVTSTVNEECVINMHKNTSITSAIPRENFEVVPKTVGVNAILMELQTTLRVKLFGP